MANFTVYTITDPPTGTVIYVGQTAHFERRIKEHLHPKPNKRRSKKATTIASILEAGVEPLFEPVSTHATRRAAVLAERAIMALHAETGALTNHPPPKPAATCSPPSNPTATPHKRPARPVDADRAGLSPTQPEEPRR